MLKNVSAVCLFLLMSASALAQEDLQGFDQNARSEPLPTMATKPMQTSSMGDVLNPGVPIPEISGASSSWNCWMMSVPPGASNLTFDISGGNGDADMYARFDAEPTMSAYDCRPYESGSSENCTFGFPSDGDYHVCLHGSSNYSGVTLTGDYGLGGGSNCAPSYDCATNTSSIMDNWNRYTWTVPPGCSQYQVKISGGAGDADLYSRFGSQPDADNYDCRPNLTGSNETCTQSSPTAGTWHIGVRAYSTFSGVQVQAANDTGIPNISSPPSPPPPSSWASTLQTECIYSSHFAQKQHCENPGANPCAPTNVYEQTKNGKLIVDWTYIEQAVGYEVVDLSDGTCYKGPASNENKLSLSCPPGNGARSTSNRLGPPLIRSQAAAFAVLARKSGCVPGPGGDPNNPGAKFAVRALYIGADSSAWTYSNNQSWDLKEECYEYWSTDLSYNFDLTENFVATNPIQAALSCADEDDGGDVTLKLQKYGCSIPCSGGVWNCNWSTVAASAEPGCRQELFYDSPDSVGLYRAEVQADDPINIDGCIKISGP